MSGKVEPEPNGDVGDEIDVSFKYGKYNFSYKSKIFMILLQQKLPHSQIVFSLT